VKGSAPRRWRLAQRTSVGGMPRGPRIVAAGATYHVTARGNRRQPIFAEDHDRHLFLRLLADVVRRHRWRCGAYCLLTNHFHLLVETPVAAEDLATGMHRLNGLYAQWFNDRHEFAGHLFQGRFHSTVIEREGHLLEVIRYVFLNPVRAGVCDRADRWPWSSHAATVGLVKAPTFLSLEMILELFSGDRRRAGQRLAAFVADAPPATK
jgi:putative transposase